MMKFIISFIEARFPGSKPMIDQALTVLRNEHDVIFAVMSSLEHYVPGTTSFIELLKEAINAAIAKQNAQIPDGVP